MNLRPILITTVLFAGHACVQAQQTNSTAQSTTSASPRTLDLHEAIDLALKHNHVVRIASMHVEEQQHAKDVARSAYLPTLRNDTTFFHVTDTQLIEIAAGSLGTAGSTPIPPQNHVLNQGGRDIFTSGTGLTQPLTELFKIRAANDAARAEVDASRGKAQDLENQVELKVRQLYYRILVTQSQH